MHNYKRERLSIVALLGALLVAGCGGGAEGDAGRQKVYKAKGKITMSGGPVANAMVSFSPKDKQPVATGRTGADGTYVLTTYDTGDGAAAGDFVVLVTKSASGGGKPSLGGHDPNKPPDASAMHAAQSAAAPGGDSGPLLPEKYSRAEQSDLMATVKVGVDNEFNFELKP